MHCNILVLFGSAHSQAMACSEAIAIMTVPKGLSTEQELVTSAESSSAGLLLSNLDGSLC